jgi:YHS domain-containing protein/thioredoxin-related protein
MVDSMFFTSRSGLKWGLGCLLVLSACSLSLAAAPREIPWRTDYSRAKAEAKARQLPLWVQFTGPWCHFCTQMERETFVSPEVIASAHERFIPVKLRSDIHEDLVSGFGVSGLPSTIIVAPTGAVVARREGFTDPKAFQAFLNQSLERTGHVARSSKRSQPERPAARAEAAPAAKPAEEPALAGHCPVTLVVDKRLTLGQPDLSARYDGREYRFATASERDTFLNEPEPYLPANHGQCLVSQVDRSQSVAGDPRFGVLYDSRLYLCADESARAKFMKEPKRYANADVADKGFCPHCRAQNGQPVRGKPEYCLTHRDQCYFFPNAEHRQAFRADPDKYIR